MTIAVDLGRKATKKKLFSQPWTELHMFQSHTYRPLVRVYRKKNLNENTCFGCTKEPSHFFEHTKHMGYAKNYANMGRKIQ